MRRSNKAHWRHASGFAVLCTTLAALAGCGASAGPTSAVQAASTQAATSPSTPAPTPTLTVPPTAVPTPLPTAVPTPLPTAVPTPAPTPPPTPSGPTLTAQQQRAADAARQYLSIDGFSRQGLIDQLSSSYGDGYSVPDATVAVDSLNEDWNVEAVKAAKNYLAMEPFSCNGLIQQLDSSYGDKFTVAQATYGAQHAGAC